MALLDVSRVEISYDNIPVVHDISFKIEPGEILGMVGESGSGKSTVIKAAMGLLGKEGKVTKGNILYKNKNIFKMSMTEQRKLRGPEMGMIFQNTSSSLCPIRKIQDQLYEAVLQHEKIEKSEIKERALELFSKMKLENGERILQSYPFELSGGMNQRVGIIMAMVLKPDLLFADEPTSALDVTVQAQVIREMMKMREEYHTAIVMITHNIGVVEHMADKVAVMYKGRLVEYGETKEIIQNPKEEYTKKLMSSVLRINKG